MDDYRLYTVVPRLVKYIDQLTNWYVRLNRKRMKSVFGELDGRTAIATLFEVILTITRAMVFFLYFFFLFFILFFICSILFYLFYNVIIVFCLLIIILYFIYLLLFCLFIHYFFLLYLTLNIKEINQNFN